MVRLCPECQFETEVRNGCCVECGFEYYFSKKKIKTDSWETEDEWTESDWGQDTEEVKGGDD